MWVHLITQCGVQGPGKNDGYKMSKLPDDVSEEDREEVQMKNIGGMFLAKEACTFFCDEFQNEISEAMYS